MNRKMVVEYNWWNDERTDVPEEHKEELQEAAEDRIFEMRKQGYIEGELHCTIYVDEDNEVEYQGWWKVKYE